MERDSDRLLADRLVGLLQAERDAARARVAEVEAALAAADPAVAVDAALIALRQVAERLPTPDAPVRTIAAAVANSHERWWLLRAHLLGLGIEPVDPWPRGPHPEWRMPAPGEGWGPPIMPQEIVDRMGLGQE